MSLRRRAAALALSMLGGAMLPALGPAQTPVLTRSYDNARTGANRNETVLTPRKVGSNLMVKLFSLNLSGDDPRLEAQPLYVPKIAMSDGKIHDVVYVGTMGNNVWAFDANNGQSIWPRPVSLGLPVKPPPAPHPGFPGATTIDMWGVNILWGILSTPVIDLDTRTMYVVNWTSADQTVENATHRLNAIDITSGKVLKSLAIAATSGQAVPPKPTPTFVPSRQKQRSALLLVPLRSGSGPRSKKVLFMACSMTSEADASTHGWLIAFDLDSFRQTAAWCTTPNSSEGGIWQAAQGPAADENGDVYVMTSNTDPARTPNPATDLPESFVKLRYTPPAGPSAVGSLAPVGSFSPFKDVIRKPEFQDEDLGSGGPVVLDDLKIVLGAGKDGVLYVLDKDHFTNGIDFPQLKQPPKFFTYSPPNADKIDASRVENLDVLYDGKTHHLHGTPAYWKDPALGPMLFVWGENESLRAWSIDGTGKTTLVGKSNEIASAGVGGLGGMPGGFPAISANGTTPNTGIVWATAPIDGDANRFIVEGILRSYDATNLDPVKNLDGIPRLKKLWDSKQIPNNTFHHAKFVPPVVADGKVFVATYDGRVDVYGLATPPTTTNPVNADRIPGR
jgi:outer membrane protein assembly factor BamB